MWNFSRKHARKNVDSPALSSFALSGRPGQHPEPCDSTPAATLFIIRSDVCLDNSGSIGRTLHGTSAHVRTGPSPGHCEESQVDPSRYYFRTTPLFETGSSRYSWLNDSVCVGSGYVVDGGVAYHVEQVL
ncbi:DUF3237 family protein [Nocardia pneumoniae]|uniref:DUF3237 family protein n=1 Tax=Nocardia pneumoniae TaxID=228601 RepID=UPI0009FE78C5